MNPDGFHLCARDCGSCKDTSGKVAWGYKEKDYRNHFKGCFSEGKV